MKKCSDELKQFLAKIDAEKLKIADLYTFSLTNGTVLRFTSADFDVVRKPFDNSQFTSEGDEIHIGENGITKGFSWHNNFVRIPSVTAEKLKGKSWKFGFRFKNTENIAGSHFAIKFTHPNTRAGYTAWSFCSLSGSNNYNAIAFHNRTGTKDNTNDENKHTYSKRYKMNDEWIYVVMSYDATTGEYSYFTSQKSFNELDFVGTKKPTDRENTELYAISEQPKFMLTFGVEYGSGRKDDKELSQIIDLNTAFFEVDNETIFSGHKEPIVFNSQNACISRSSMSWETGLSVDDLTVEFNPSEKDVLGDITLVQAFRNGSFDGAKMQLDLAFYAEGWNEEPNVLEKLFAGTLDVEEIGGSYVKCSAKSYTELLNSSFPAHVYQAGCCYSLYGAGCNVDRKKFSQSGYVLQNSTKKQINCNFSQPAGYFQNGVITFLSGKNINVKRSVKFHEKTYLQLSTPLQYEPAIGDKFEVAAGCNKTLATCQSKFNNKANFSGTPYVPKAESTAKF